MAELDAVAQGRVAKALDTVARRTTVSAAFLFGSYAEGTQDRWSDIDLAVFVSGLRAWSPRDRAALSAQVQKEAGDEVELHVFPAEALRERDPASFAAWVIANGVPVRGPAQRR